MSAHLQRLRGFAVVAAIAFASASPAAAASPNDGRWAVTLVCPGSPDGTQSFTFEFTADVANGSLHCEHGGAGQPGWLSLDGHIRADGGASLSANGITGHQQFNYAETARGLPYRHPVTARFEAQRGTGQWTKPRVGNFTFVKM
jgi:hypothetical protein